MYINNILIYNLNVNDFYVQVIENMWEKNYRENEVKYFQPFFLAQY